MRFVLALLVGVSLLCGCDDESKSVQQAAAPPSATVTPREGIAVAIVVDVSGSMGQSVNDVGGHQSPKIDIAQRAVKQLYERSEKFSKDNAERSLEVSLYAFNDQPSQMIQFAKPAATGANAVIDQLRPNGGTGIGRAILKAKADLDATGLSQKHIVVVTDGENTDGPTPAEVATEMSKNPAKPAVYMVAFDVNADIFQKVKSDGWLVYSASDAKELQQALDVIFGENILLER